MAGFERVVKNIPAASKVGGRSALSFELASSLLPLIDVIIFVVCSLAATFSYQRFYGDFAASLLGVAIIASSSYTFRMHSIGYYDIRLWLQPRLDAKSIIYSWAICAIVLVLLAFLLKNGASYSRRSVIAFLLLSLVALIAWRALAGYLLRLATKNRILGKLNVVVLGEQNELRTLSTERLLRTFGVIEARQFVLNNYSEASSISASDAKVVKSAIDFVRENTCEEILLALPWRTTEALQSIRDQLRMLPIPVRLLPDTTLSDFTSRISTSFLKPTFLIELQSAPLGYSDRLIKRLIDIVIASVALVLLTPTMLLTAIAVKLDSSGPPLFRQHRNGFNRKSFVIYKFRTMTVEEDGPNLRQASRRDPRVTRIGRLLRMTSIDELPQLFNVLRGEMSLVGPRPHALSHDNQFQYQVSDYALRHHVKPGITGWAQCHGLRGETPLPADIVARVEYDLWYIANWSLWLDMRILAMTVFEMMHWDRAY